MSIQPADIAIFLISFAACAYCIVLSRRLKALQNTKDGLGATIMALSNSISAMSSTTKDTRNYAGELASQLAKLMTDADTMCRKIERLTNDMEHKHIKAQNELKSSEVDASKRLTATLAESEAKITEMKEITAQMQSLTERTTDAIQRAVRQTATPDFQPLTEVVRINE